MEKFFAKHTRQPDESDAIRMVHDKVEDSLERLRTSKGDKYIRDLATAYELICDFFDAKGIDIDSYIETE